jgi:predicted RNA binding protein YcfA (HicA-like mRNA interferase family)
MNKVKLLRQILNNPKNVKFNDFVSILSAYGFVCTRTEGSHNIFKNASVKEFINVHNVDGEAKPYQIRQFFSLVEKYNLRMEDNQ